MLQKCLVLFAAVVSSLVIATSASALGKIYSLKAGSGAQLHIGNGLALPIQAAFAGTGMAQPPLLIGRQGGVDRPVYQTTNMATLKNLTVPNGVLAKSASQTTVGMFLSNTTLYAVGTGLSYAWPAGASGLKTFSTGIRATTTVTHIATGGSTARYSPGLLAKQFGGAARFSIDYPGGLGLFPNNPVSVYAIAGGAPPACDFMAPNPACRALMIGATPAPVGAIGGTTAGGQTVTISTAGKPIGASVQLKAGPGGTISSVYAINPGPPLTNMALSKGYPFTAGRITLMAVGAVPAENFVLSGTDNRNSAGVGTISMVAGALSQRALSGPNANRAWVRLVIDQGNPLSGVPALSTWGRAAAVGFIGLVAVGYMNRSRFSSKAA